MPIETQIEQVKEWRHALKHADAGRVFHSYKEDGSTIKTHGLPQYIQDTYEKTSEAAWNTFKALFSQHPDPNAFFKALANLIAKQSPYAFHPLLRSQGLERSIRELITSANNNNGLKIKQQRNVLKTINRGADRLKKHAKSVRNSCIALSIAGTSGSALFLLFPLLSPMVVGNAGFIALYVITIAAVAAVSFGCTAGLYRRNVARFNALKQSANSLFPTGSSSSKSYEVSSDPYYPKD